MTLINCLHTYIIPRYLEDNPEDKAEDIIYVEIVSEWFEELLFSRIMYLCWEDKVKYYQISSYYLDTSTTNEIHILYL